MPKVTREMLLIMLVKRAMGFRQEEIARELGVSQNTVKYYLKKIRERAEEEGLPLVFYSIVLGPLGAPIVAAATLERILRDVLREAEEEGEVE